MINYYLKCIKQSTNSNKVKYKTQQNKITQLSINAKKIYYTEEFLKFNQNFGCHKVILQWPTQEHYYRHFKNQWGRN